MAETIFDADEQKFIAYLNSNTEEKRIENYLDPSLENTTIEVHPETKQVYFKFAIQSNIPTSEESDWIIKKSDNMQLSLVKLTRLVTYLEENKLVYSFFPAYQQRSEICFGQCPENQPFVGYTIYDPKTIDGLINLVGKIIEPTPSLEELQKNKFKFPEQTRFKQSKTLGVIGIIVAIILSLLGIGYNLYSSKQSNETVDYQLKQMQLNIENLNRNTENINGNIADIKTILENQEVIQGKLSKELRRILFDYLKQKQQDVVQKVNHASQK